LGKRAKRQGGVFGFHDSTIVKACDDIVTYLRWQSSGLRTWLPVIARSRSNRTIAECECRFLHRLSCPSMGGASICLQKWKTRDGVGPAALARIR
jgi:hypothetical protein